MEPEEQSVEIALVGQDRLSSFAAALGRECADLAVTKALDQAILVLLLDDLRSGLNGAIAEWPDLEPEDFFRAKDLAEEAFLNRLSQHLSEWKAA